jgi:hypothetical protein
MTLDGIIFVRIQSQRMNEWISYYTILCNYYLQIVPCLYESSGRADRRRSNTLADLGRKGQSITSGTVIGTANCGGTDSKSANGNYWLYNAGCHCWTRFYFVVVTTTAIDVVDEVDTADGELDRSKSITINNRSFVRSSCRLFSPFSSLAVWNCLLLGRWEVVKRHRLLLRRSSRRSAHEKRTESVREHDTSDSCQLARSVCSSTSGKKRRKEQKEERFGTVETRFICIVLF